MKTDTDLAESVPNLPWELQVEILSWLPVKTLMQFRCVSKSWKSLISNDKAFQNLHLHRSPKNKHVLLTLEEYDVSPGYIKDYEDYSLILFPMHRLVEDPSSIINEDEFCTLKGKYRIVGSCNGLVCIKCISYTFNTSNWDIWIRLWNPVTRLWSNEIPTLTVTDLVSFGFGYDGLCDTYKVVGILLDRCVMGPKLETIVYCIGDSCWRKVSGNIGFQLSLESRFGQFVGGCLNWLAYHQLDNDTDLNRIVIVSFDMHKETYRSLSLPEGTSEWEPDIITNLIVLENCLCLFQDRIGTHFDVWQQKEYGIQESWTRLLSVSYEHLQCDGNHFGMLMPQKCLGEDGDILMLFRNRNMDVILYNLRDNSLKHIQLPDYKIWLDANSYVQSLVSPY